MLHVRVFWVPLFDAVRYALEAVVVEDASRLERRLIQSAFVKRDERGRATVVEAVATERASADPA